MKQWLAAFALSVGLISAASGAVRVEQLYETEVAVADQSAAERHRAQRDALARILTRLTGQQAFAKQPALADALEHAGRYVQQYRYRTRAPREGEPGAASPVLWVRFESQAVEQLVAEAGLPLWGRERPVTLVWLAVDRGDRRYLVGTDNEGAVRRAVQAEAKRRGVPLVFPLLDLQDQAQVRFADVWGGFTDALRTASRRYATEAVLMGRLYRISGGGWRARWSLLSAAGDQHWTATGTALESVVATGVDGLADRLVTRYAFYPGQDGEVRVRVQVDDVNTLDDYARVSRYLGSRPVVRQARLLRVDGAGLHYELVIQGGPSALRQSVELGDVLVPAQRPTGVPTDTPAVAATTLRYRLLR